MLAELYADSQIVRGTFEEASEIMQKDIANLCFKEDEQNLQDITISAPIILAAGVASFRHIVEEYKIYPSIMAGHSLGEYSALVCSGILPFDEAINLVTERSKLAKTVMEKTNGVMNVVYRCSSSDIREICKKMRKKGAEIWIACYNSPTQVSVAGKERDVNQLEILVKQIGGGSKRLVGNAPYHSPLMLDVATDFKLLVENCSVQTFSCPVISNYKVAPYTTNSIVENLVQQLTNPVLWDEILYYIVRQNIDTVIELGSGKILTNLINASSYKVQAFSYEKNDNRQKLEQLLRKESEVIR